MRNYCILNVSPNSDPPVFLIYFATACKLNVLKTDVLKKIYGNRRSRASECVCVFVYLREKGGGRQIIEGRGNLYTERTS